jgi:hypothetical protein
MLFVLRLREFDGASQGYSERRRPVDFTVYAGRKRDVGVGRSRRKGFEDRATGFIVGAAMRRTGSSKRVISEITMFGEQGDFSTRCQENKPSLCSAVATI